MIALVRNHMGPVRIAERMDIGQLIAWKTLDGGIWLESWVHILEELESLDKARLAYPEYFV